MVRRVFIATLASMAMTGLVMAHGNTLWEHFKGALPEMDERAFMYEDNGGQEVYSGTKEQNIYLYNVIHTEPILGSLAFPPSTVEGTSTAGWTDSGSVVRLNTAADSVGIGTTNPPEKLSVVGGNFYLSGNLSASGGTYNLGSTNGTSTLSVQSGLLGIGTTTPRATLAVQGTGLFAGTTTVGGLISTSTITSTGSGTSTYGGGISVTTGCFAIGTTCVAGSGASGYTLLSAPADVGVSITNSVKATTSLISSLILANTLTANSAIRITGFATTTVSGNNTQVFVNFNMSLGGGATTTCGAYIGDGTNATYSATSTYSFVLRVNSASSQSLKCYSKTDSTVVRISNYQGGSTGGQTVFPSGDFSSVSSNVDTSANQTLFFAGFQTAAGSPGTTNVSFYGITAELLKP